MIEKCCLQTFVILLPVHKLLFVMRKKKYILSFTFSLTNPVTDLYGKWNVTCTVVSINIQNISIWIIIFKKVGGNSMSYIREKNNLLIQVWSIYHNIIISKKQLICKGAANGHSRLPQSFYICDTLIRKMREHNF
jgi:hypothetical protein